ncbi:hypothetical protein DFH06DRAFT_328383 [Mycena polygramma]|nr:hypothetical protein DFH06DRAFT_328383 [Mycena polygramma]
MNDSHRDLQGSFPQSDHDLFRAQQHKVHERVRAIDRSLANLVLDIASAQQELDDISQLEANTRARLIKLERAKAEAKKRLERRMCRDKLLNRGPSTPAAAPVIDEAPPPWAQWATETTRLRDLCRRLDEKRAALLRERNAIVPSIPLDAFVSAPVRQIPEDVLRQIFAALNCTVDKPKSVRSGDVTAKRNIVGVGHGTGSVVSRVCSQWRAVAWDHPLLWSSFSFPILADNSAQLVELYLQRSKSAPLTVEIDATRRPHAETGSTGERAIALLAAHSQRLFELQIFTNQPAGEVLISIPSLQPMRGNLPSLEILQIPVWPAMSNEFARIPRLHTLRLCSPHSGRIEHGQHFECSRVRRLTLCDANGDELAAYPNVTDFTCVETAVHDKYAAPLTSPSAPSPVCARVTAWTVQYNTDRGDNGWGISNVFRRFTLPGLRSLDAQYREGSSELVGFIQRSRCSLTKLVLRDCKLRISALLQILQLTPDLESLTVLGGHTTMITDRMFDFLVVREDLASNLPSLSSLTLAGPFAFGTESLVNMVESRTADGPLNSSGKPRLGDVFLTLPDRDIQAELLQRLRGLEGVTVVLECLDRNKTMHRAL